MTDEEKRHPASETENAEDEFVPDIDSYRSAIAEAVASAIEDLTEAARLSKDDPIEAGRELGLYEVLDTLKDRLIINGIQPEELGLDDRIDEIIGSAAHTQAAAE